MCLLPINHSLATRLLLPLLLLDISLYKSFHRYAYQFTNRYGLK